VQQEPRGDTEGVERVEIWEGDFPLSNRLGVLESVVSSPSAVQGWALAENGFHCFPMHGLINHGAKRAMAQGPRRKGPQRRQ